MPNYLWFRFNPEVRYKVEHFEFDSGKQFIRGHFAYAYFDLKDKRFVFLPNFNNYMFIAQKNEKGKYNMKSELVRVFDRLFRNYRKSYGNSSVPVDQYVSPKGEFKSEISCTVDVKSQKYPFAMDTSAMFFAAFGASTDFDGSTEIYRVGYDLNDKYPSELLSAWYREEIVTRLKASFFSDENSPIVLVGPEGVGKKSIVHECVYRYMRENEGTSGELLQKFWYLDPTRVIAGMSIVGMWQKRFEAILNHVLKRRSLHPKVKDRCTDKLLVDNAVALLRIGRSAQNDMCLADVLKPYLEKRLMRLVILATPEEWKIVQEGDRRFADLFQIIRINEPDRETAVKMVLHKRKLLEIDFGCAISAHAIHKLFAIHRNFFKRRALPGGVMRLLNQMAVKYKYQTIDVGEVESEFEDFSGLSQRIFDEDIVFEHDEIRDEISSGLVGQELAVSALSDTVHLIKSKLTDPSRPNGSFLFIGPTGVGKTQAAKVLAKFLMENEERLMRFDMNEYIDPFAVSRLIGDENRPEGQLTGKVRYNPFGVVLLDEIEKAHPKVHDLLLQVLDDGRLTDAVGRTVDFSNTIIIMTSNVGADQLSGRVGFAAGTSEMEAIYRKAVESVFRPEFINRIGNIVIFKPLTKQHILGIARLQINELLKRDGFVRRTTILNISEEALEWVSDRGYDEKMGGRALKRQIEKDLTALSAEQLLGADGETPVIMDIELRDDRLYPSITPLDFADTLGEEWLPELPHEKQGKRYYGRLLRVIEKIERKIRAYDEDMEDDDSDGIIYIGDQGEDSDWQYYDYKNRLAQIKDKINDLMLGFRDTMFKGGPAIPFRLKGGGLGSFIPRSNDPTRGIKHTMRDRFFQQQGLAELNEFYRLAADQFDSLNTEFLDSYLDVAFLSLQSRGFLGGDADLIRIEYHSCIEGVGEQQVKFLMDLHTKYFEAFDIPFERNDRKGTIEAESHSLFELMEGEQGIHLFYIPHQTPLPIRVLVESSEYVPGRRKDMDVIRLYDTKGTLVDIRTGFSNTLDITAEEFKLFLFGGLESGLRNELLMVN